jgi:hypothetical protein
MLPPAHTLATQSEGDTGCNRLLRVAYITGRVNEDLLRRVEHLPLAIEHRSTGNQW